MILVPSICYININNVNTYTTSNLIMQYIMHLINDSIMLQGGGTGMAKNASLFSSPPILLHPTFHLIDSPMSLASYVQDQEEKYS